MFYNPILLREIHALKLKPLEDCNGPKPDCNNTPYKWNDAFSLFVSNCNYLDI